MRVKENETEKEKEEEVTVGGGEPEDVNGRDDGHEQGGEGVDGFPTRPGGGIGLVIATLTPGNTVVQGLRNG